VLPLGRAGDDDHLILANVERHQIGAKRERPGILFTRLALKIGDCRRRILWAAQEGDMRLRNKFGLEASK